ncbi:YhbY family RNA-binding protein [Oleiagrimonas sp.]|jgi:RNA-binding protein|uniref:YhbY family RNA-binding protein n=1 Tax=Oleiagrimonas sp. TaxID=2010330 RepID=UPI00260E8FDD|nr:YhbY family RNA-binding protein [Oleiagrimonas sp.]MDA3913646.1 YhbY family RNA-binding protein [Oleiagrimonas sp.]
MTAPTPTPSGTASALTASQRRYLRGLCQDLHPIIMLGAKGVSEAVTRELEIALDHHELVKIKLSGGDRDQRQLQIDQLAEATGASVVQQIGHTASVFRRNADEPKLALPR